MSKLELVQKRGNVYKQIVKDYLEKQRTCKHPSEALELVGRYIAPEEEHDDSEGFTAHYVCKLCNKHFTQNRQYRPDGKLTD